MKNQLTEADINQIFNALELGLTIDGGHHKQWALVKIADVLGVELEDEIRKEAIAP